MKKFKLSLVYLFAFLVVVYSLFPFYWALISSFKSGSALFAVEFFPKDFNLANYKSVLFDYPFLRNMLNSLLVSTGVVIVSTALSVFAAFALGRIPFRGRSGILAVFLSVSMFPQIAVLSGMFELIRFLGLYNNLIGLGISYLIFTLPFTVWILTSFMKGLPRQLEEAAIMDGAPPLTMVMRIFLPLVLPSCVTVGLLAFIAAWNEFLFALTLTMSDSARTVPVAIALMSGASQFESPWGNIMAASVLVTLPLVLLVLLFQKRIIAGLTAGALKG